jgi:16S rRNA (uracil1498-N3)-methyltransferase
MEIGDPQQSAEYFASANAATIRLLANPAGEALSEVAPNAALAEVHAAVGPEGGFTTCEAAAASAAGWRLVSLGPRILRVETAAIALAAWAALR